MPNRPGIERFPSRGIRLRRRGPAHGPLAMQRLMLFLLPATARTRGAHDMIQHGVANQMCDLPCIHIYVCFGTPPFFRWNALDRARMGPYCTASLRQSSAGGPSASDEACGDLLHGRALHSRFRTLRKRIRRLDSQCNCRSKDGAT